MKIKTVVLCVFVFFAAVPFSQAFNESGSDVSVKHLLDYNSIQDRDPESKKTGPYYLANYKDTTDERIDLDRGGSAAYLEWSEAPSEPHAVAQTGLRPLVYDISVVSYSDDTHSGIDLGFLSSFGGVFQLGTAFLTNLFVHEFGHEVVANYVDARGSRLDFFKRDGDQFFLGTSTVESIDERSMVPYVMGGEFFADISFEHALQDYRRKPSTFNKSLMLASGTDFLWYCFYAFYLSDGHQNFDPVSVSERTGLSKDTLFSIVAAKTLVNAYRAYSGQDTIIPYFSVDKYSASLNVIIPFEIDTVFGMFAGNSASDESAAPGYEVLKY